MGSKKNELERNSVLDGERDIDWQYIVDGELDKLWDKYSKSALSYSYNAVKASPVLGVNGEYVDIAHKSFMLAVKKWNKERGGFRTFLSVCVLHVSSREKRSLCAQSRSGIMIPLDGEDCYGERYERFSSTDLGFASIEFIDRINGADCELKAALLYCINNAQNFGWREMDTRCASGEKSPLMVGACGTIGYARKMLPRIRNFLFGNANNKMLLEKRKDLLCSEKRKIFLSRKKSSNAHTAEKQAM